MRYALLISPSTNRVYAGAAPQLARAELEVVSLQVLGGAVSDVRNEQLGGVDYVTFTAPELDELAAGWLSNLAATFALFRLEDDGRLCPLPLLRWDQLDSDLLTIQRYAGKTNEAFTKLLVNLTLAASAFARERRALSLLDPFAGRGTTLNQALTYGFHATGVELDRKDFEAYSTFIQRWVKDKRLKHHAVLGHVKGHPKLDLELGVTKERFKAGDTQRLCYVSADTHAIEQVFQHRSFDLIVTDAPYGVQHGAQAGGTTTRRPLELFASVLPLWRAALRSGGALGIAWNTLVARREELLRLVSEHGFTPCDSPAHRALEHRVDQAIQRDVLIARVS